MWLYPHPIQDKESSIDDFVLKTETFIINKHPLNYKQIKHISAERKLLVTKKFLGSLKSREVTMKVRYDSASMELFFLRENGPDVYTSRKDFKIFEEKYKMLLEKTFQYRIHQYEESINISGRFNLYGITFFIGDKVQKGDTIIPKEDVEFHIENNEIQIQNRKSGNVGKDTVFKIPMDVDPDVVFTLVEYFKKTTDKPDLLPDLITRGSVIMSKYVVVNKLGEGAFGEVFRARHANLNVERAIKLILPNKKNIDSNQLNFYSFKFKQEAQIGASLESPHIVRVYDFGAFANGLALIMEDVKGVNLQEKIMEAVGENKYIRFNDCLGILKDCLKGLSTLHIEGYVHRDIKPANILLDSNGHAKISDLGISQTQTEKKNWTASNRHPGTIMYMSPEQKESEGPLLPQSDIFSLGLTFFEVLFLRPWKDIVVNGIYLKLRNDIPDWFYQILIKMVSKDVDSRPKSCQSILHMIEESESQLINKTTIINTQFISNRSISNIPMVFIPDGPVEIGTASDTLVSSAEDSPTHTVSLTSFWISKYPISIIQFYEFMRETDYVTTAERQGYGIVAELENENIKFVPVKGANWRQPYGPNILLHYSLYQPVTTVSWLDAVEYCNWLSHKLKTIVRLPSEVEWEKAAQGKQNAEWPWGDKYIDSLKCNFGNHIGVITPSDKYSPESDSCYGCADMLGNIWEWTQSAFRPYPYNKNDGREEYGLTEKRVLRGGSLLHYPSIRYRDADPPDSAFFNDGFRIVVEKL